MLDKPGFFGLGERFSYFSFLFSGYCWGRGTGVSYMPDQELQHWLFHTQSASFYGSIRGESLFFRCFGIRQIAFEKNRDFLHSTLSKEQPVINCNNMITMIVASINPGVSVEILAHEDNHDLVRHDLIHNGIPTDNLDFVRAAVKSINKHGEVRYDWADDIEPDHHMNLARSVVGNIRKMIEKMDLTYDDLRIYVRRERLFNQVRFLFRCENKWIDDEAIIANPENHDLLVAIHANAKNASSEALQTCGCDVFDNQDYDFEFIPVNISYDDEKTFYSEHLQWRDAIISEDE